MYIFRQLIVRQHSCRAPAQGVFTSCNISPVTSREPKILPYASCPNKRLFLQADLVWIGVKPLGRIQAAELSPLSTRHVSHCCVTLQHFRSHLPDSHLPFHQASWAWEGEVCQKNKTWIVNLSRLLRVLNLFKTLSTWSVCGFSANHFAVAAAESWNFKPK